MFPMTGLLPNRPETRALYASERRFQASGGAMASILQRAPYIRDQLAKPSCVGHSIAACVDGALPSAPWCSALDLWTDARRRMGLLEDATSGVRIEYGIESLLERGWSREKPGEDGRPVSKDRQMPSLMDELDATDKRMTGARHYSIVGERSSQVVDALSRGLGVVMGTGVREPYYFPPRNRILGPDFLGGDENGHAQRVRGYSAQRDAFVIQGSWNMFFGGCDWEDGRFLYGCVLVSREVIELAWDVEVFEIKIR